MKYDIKDMVKGSKVVNFVRYYDGDLWYRTECGFDFPVPILDIGNATFEAQDKAMLFMRYIRKHIKTVEESKNETR